MENIDILVNDFIKEALIYSKAIPKGEKNLANKANKKMIQIYKKINSLGEDVKLKKYLNHENIGVRLCVASNIIKTYPGEAIKILQDIIKQDNIFSLLAEMGLDLWHTGKL